MPATNALTISVITDITISLIVGQRVLVSVIWPSATSRIGSVSVWLPAICYCMTSPQVPVRPDNSCRAVAGI